MPASPIHTLAHTLIPNLVKLKGHTAFVMACERKDKSFFAQTWQQAFVTHDPKTYYATRDNTDGSTTFRIGILDLPEPREMGDVYMIASVVKKNDSTFGRLFLLEKDWVMKTKQDKTTIAEREGAGASGRRSVHGDGPKLAGTFDGDAKAFSDVFMELLIPSKVARK